MYEQSLFNVSILRNEKLLELQITQTRDHLSIWDGKNV